MARVMVIQDTPSESRRLTKIFQSVNVPVEVAATFDVAMERIAQDPPILVVAPKPSQLEKLHGLNAVIQNSAPATPFIVTIPDGKMETAMEALQLGAFDCVAKPYYPLDILMASKRAAMRSGRMLFVKKLSPRVSPMPRIVGALVMSVILIMGILKLRQGPPPNTFSLGSANLSGIQWVDRTLWVGDWFESTITEYEAEKGLLKRFRTVRTKNIYKMQDGQPILVCDTPDLIVTVAADLKMRIHKRDVGLPSFQTIAAPGTNPTGLAWDGTNLWSCDSQTNLLYKHGQDLRVIDTVKSIFPHPYGLAWDGSAMWVIGDKPLKVARLEMREGGRVWQGPQVMNQLLAEGVPPTGFAIGFNRLWAISGGDPKIVSAPLPQLTAQIPVKNLEKAATKKKKGNK